VLSLEEYKNYQLQKKKSENKIQKWATQEAQKQKEEETQKLNDPNISNEEKEKIKKWGSINNKEITKKKIIKDSKEDILRDLAKNDRHVASEKISKLFQIIYKTYSIRNDEKSEIYVYQNGVYKENGKSFIKEFCREIAGYEFTTYLINEIINKIEVDSFIEPEIFYNSEPKEEIALENGIYNIKTGKLQNFTHKKIFFNKIPIKYVPEAKPKKFIEFVNDILENPEDVTMLQELFGYLLYKDYQIEKSFMFFGGGRNGKGQLLDLMRCFVGINNVSAVSLQRVCDEDSFNIVELHKKLINIGGDISDNYLETTGMFKQLTGNDTVSVKRKFQADLKFKNYAKLIFSCNSLPKAKDNSRGFWDRWILLKFPFRFEHQEILDEMTEEEKFGLKPRKNNIIQGIINDENEMSGLFNWALIGLNRLLKQEHFTFTPATRDVRDRWIKEADSFAAFCDEMLKEEYGTMISKEELRSEYHAYCKKNMLKAVGDKAMKNHLEREMGAYDDRYRDEKMDKRVWKNISFVQGVQGVQGFSTLGEFTRFNIGVKPLVKSVNPDSHHTDMEKTTLKEQKNIYNIYDLVKYVKTDSNLTNACLKFGSDLVEKAKRQGVIYQPDNNTLKIL